jgi:hypothetical protein
MGICGSLNQVARHAGTCVGGYAQTLWNGRLVQVMGAMTCIALLGLLVMRIKNIFTAKPPPPPAEPEHAIGPDIQPLIRASQNARMWDLAIISRNQLIQRWRMEERNANLDNHKTVADGKALALFTLPAEIWAKIFTYRDSLATWYALSETCKTFRQQAHHVTCLAPTISSTLSKKIEPLFEDWNSISSAENMVIIQALVNVLSCLPPAALFPEDEESHVPSIRDFFEKLENRFDSNCTPGYWRDLMSLLRQRFYPADSNLSLTVTDLDKKFLYNLSDERLTLSTRGEIEESNRRFSLGRLQEKPTPFQDNLWTLFKDEMGNSIFLPFLTWSSCELLRAYLARTFADKRRSVLISGLIQLENREDACKKLCLFGEEYQLDHRNFGEQGEKYVAQSILCTTMYFLGWQEGEITQNPPPIDLQQILVWFHETALQDPLEFVLTLFSHPDEFRFYQPKAIVEFIKYLGEHIPKLDKSPEQYSCTELQQILQTCGPTLHFSEKKWYEAMLSSDQEDTPHKVHLWTEYCLRHRKQWSAHKHNMNQAMLAVSFMRLLKWQPLSDGNLATIIANNQPLLDKETHPCWGSESYTSPVTIEAIIETHIADEASFKTSCQEDFDFLFRPLQHSSNPYKIEDLVIFALLNIKKWSERNKLNSQE